MSTTNDEKHNFTCLVPSGYDLAICFNNRYRWAIRDHRTVKITRNNVKKIGDYLATYYIRFLRKSKVDPRSKPWESYGLTEITLDFDGFLHSHIYGMLYPIPDNFALTFGFLKESKGKEVFYEVLTEELNSWIKQGLKSKDLYVHPAFGGICNKEEAEEELQAVLEFSKISFSEFYEEKEVGVFTIWDIRREMLCAYEGFLSQRKNNQTMGLQLIVPKKDLNESLIKLANLVGVEIKREEDNKT